MITYLNHLRIRGGERGASAVEFALLAPVFFMLVFGMFSGGLLFEQNNELTHAARDGARYGATVPLEEFNSTCGGTSGTCWATSVLNETRNQADGNLAVGAAGVRVCVALVTGSPATVVSVAGQGTYWTDVGAGASGSAAPCFDDGGADSNRRVQVAVFKSATFNAVLFGVNMTLHSEGLAQHEE
jgi:hypothetical protein